MSTITSASRKSVKNYCDYCRKDISSIISIKCAVCNDIDLCLNCFAAGVEIHPHKNNHDYYVKDVVKTPIFEYNWGADEELLLLELIETCGMGNWSGIADAMVTKTAQECARHYQKIYLDSKYSPLPDISKELPTKESASLEAAKIEEEKRKLKLTSQIVTNGNNKSSLNKRKRSKNKESNTNNTNNPKKI